MTSRDPASTPDAETDGAAGRRAPPRLTTRDQLRAVLIAVHVVAVIALAFPSGGSLTNRAAWRSENTQADFAAWTSGLNQVGVAITPKQFEAWLWRLAKGYGAAHSRITRPFRPYARHVGARQPWQMFASPQRHPGELHVDIEERGEWRPLYRSRSREHTWRRRQMDHDRLRKFVGRFARGFIRKHYDALAVWLATEAAREFPESTRVRVRLYRYRSPPPDRARARQRPRGRYEHARYFDTETLR